jgi:hypothetical protein
LRRESLALSHQLSALPVSALVLGVPDGRVGDAPPMLTVSNGTSRLKRSGQEGVGLSQGLVEDSQAVAASASLTLSGGAINSSLASTTRIARTDPSCGRSGVEAGPRSEGPHRSTSRPSPGGSGSASSVTAGEHTTRCLQIHRRPRWSGRWQQEGCRHQLGGIDDSLI